MSDDEKTFRTPAFYTDGGGGYLYRFWVMSPSYLGPGYQIKEHERGVHCGSTARVADALSESDALHRLGALERAAAADAKIVTGKDLEELGPAYHEAQPFTDRLDAACAENIHIQLRKRRPDSGFRPK